MTISLNPKTCEYCGHKNVHRPVRTSKVHLCAACSKMMNYRTDTRKAGKKYRLWARAGKPVLHTDPGLWEEERVRDILHARVMSARAMARGKRTLPMPELTVHPPPDITAPPPTRQQQKTTTFGERYGAVNPATLTMEELRLCTIEYQERIKRAIAEMKNLPAGTQLPLFPS